MEERTVRCRVDRGKLELAEIVLVKAVGRNDQDRTYLTRSGQTERATLRLKWPLPRSFVSPDAE